MGSDITSVTAGLQQNGAQWVVDLSLNAGAASSFETLTTSQYNSYYAGYQATDLADALKYGSLPLEFQPLTENTVPAQLGHASLVAGLAAGIIGLSLVTIYLLAYYRALGLVAVSSLLLAALLANLSVVLLSRYENFTMSLSAIAGLVVAIGITADLLAGSRGPAGALAAGGADDDPARHASHRGLIEIHGVSAAVRPVGTLSCAVRGHMQPRTARDNATQRPSEHKDQST